jgi:hypothetical protein
MDSRTKYVKTLERELNSARAVINELVQENYKLRELLSDASNDRQYSRQPSMCEAA